MDPSDPQCVVIVKARNMPGHNSEMVSFCQIFSNLNLDYEYAQIEAGVVKDKKDSQAAKWQDWNFVDAQNQKKILTIFVMQSRTESNDPGGSLAAKLWNWNEAQFQRWEMNEKFWKYYHFVSLPGG